MPLLRESDGQSMPRLRLALGPQHRYQRVGIVQLAENASLA